MRILHVLEATQGGTRRHILDLLPGLQRRGFECELIYSLRRYPPFEADAQELRANGIPCREIPMTHRLNLATNLGAVARLAIHLRNNPPDVLHLHSTVAGVVGRLALLLSGQSIPCVYTPHCIAYDTGMGTLPRRSARLLEKWLAPLVYQFIAVSQHEARLLKSTLGSASDINVVYNGINLTEFDALAGPSAANYRQELPGEPPFPDAANTPTAFVIGCFGRISRQKNQEALVRALPGLRRTIPGIKLLLVGDGELQADMLRLAAHLGVTDLINWLGDVPEARPWYPRCHVVVQPSRWEGCPYSVLEGLAARRPVLATPVGGVPELLAALGTTLLPGGTDLAARLQDLAAQPILREEMGQLARLHIEENFALEQMLHGTSAVYSKARPS